VRRRRVLVALIVIVLLGTTAGYTGWWLSSGRFGRIPSVTNLTQDHAIQKLRAAGYKVSSTTETDYSETVASGSVIDTKPSSGSRKPHGATVELIVSKGQERYVIPTTAHLSLNAARAALAAIPVQVADATQKQYQVGFSQGSVIGTDPPVGTKVKRDTPVTIILSLGPPIMQVPPIDPGTPADQAKQTLQQAGFQVKVVQAFSDQWPKNTVVDVEPHDQARQGSTITLTVSKGPSTVVIPNFDALTPLDDVRKQLQQLGLVVKVEKAFGGRANRVVGIDPPSGTTVPIGTTVTVTVV
jgi:beta-lactam-binding protein with PASTA domain